MCPHLCFWRGLNVGLKCFLLCGTHLWSLKEKQRAKEEGAVGSACHFRMMDEGNSRFVISDKKLVRAWMQRSPSRDPPQGLGLRCKVYPFPDDSVYACAYGTSV